MKYLLSWGCWNSISLELQTWGFDCIELFSGVYRSSWSPSRSNDSK